MQMWILHSVCGCGTDVDSGVGVAQMGCVGVHGTLVEWAVHCMPDSVAKHVYKSLPANFHIASANEEEQERASKSSAEGKLLLLLVTSDWR